MAKYLAVLAFVCWCVPTTSNASEPFDLRLQDPLQQPWRISRFDELDGRGLKCMAADPAGNLWFGIQNGATRYDGRQWQDHTPEHGLFGGPVESIAVRARGTIIAATADGLFEFDGQRWRRQFPTQGVSRIAITFVTETRDGVLWAGCSWGLLRLSNNGTTLYTSAGYRDLARLGFVDFVEGLPEPCVPSRRYPKGSGIVVADRYVVSISDDSPAGEAGLQIGDTLLGAPSKSSPQSQPWSANPGEVITLTVKRLKSNKQELITFTARENPDRVRSPAVHSVTEDSKGRIWVGATEGRVFVSEDGGSNWHTWSKQENLIVGKYPIIVENTDGEIGVVSSERHGGLCRYRESWQHESLSELEHSDFTSTAVVTGDGSLWISGRNRLLRYSDGNWNVADTRNLKIPGNIKQMLVAPDGALWLAGDNRYAVRIAMSPREFLSVKDLNYQCTQTDGTRWFIHTGGDRIVRDDGSQARSFGVEDDVVEKPVGIVAVDGVGVVAFGSHQGVASASTFNGISWQRVDFPGVASHFSGKGFTVARDGRVWIAARGDRHGQQIGGIVAGIGNTWEHFAPPPAPRYATSIMELPDGRMFFTGGYGVVIFDGTDWTLMDDESLRSTLTPQGTIDRAGNVWVATRNRGVMRFRDGVWTTFNREHGLLSNEVSTIAVGPFDQLWASTTEGLCRFDGTRFHAVDLPEHFGRQSLKFDKDNSIWFDGVHRFGFDAAAPSVKVEQRSINAESGSSVLLQWQGTDAWNRTPSDKLSWSFQIDDQPWSTYQRKPQVVLTNLATGEHTFRVRARDSDFNQSEFSELTSIAVRPPIWMRPWLWGLASAVLVVLACLSLSLIQRSLALRTTNTELANATSLLAEQFAEKSAQFRAICDCSPIGIFVTDTSGQVTYTNHYLQQLAGFTSLAAKGMGWASSIHDEDRPRVVDAWQRAIAGDQPFAGSGRFVHRDGAVMNFSVVADRIYNEGELIGYVGAVEDVTQRLAASEELSRSNDKLRQALDQLHTAQENAIKRERLSALGQMAAGVAHDINNALAPLLSYSELLTADSQIQGQNRERIELIRLGVSDTAGIVKRLEHFYRKSHNREFLDSLDLAEVVSQVVEMTKPKWQNIAQSEGKEIAMVIDIRARPIIDGDPAQIRAVLTNLVFNAVDAIVREGTITITLTDSSDRAILEVIDNGDGMTKEQLKHCLEPFYTSKPKGSGLGLSECHGVVRQHGGEIEIVSEFGRGTRVRVLLPRQTPTVGDRDRSTSTTDRQTQQEDTTDSLWSPTKGTSAAQAPGSVPTVLYIEDDATVRGSTVALLNSVGIAVETAADGPSGLQRLETSCFGLVICDQGLPGMDGIAVLNEIKRRHPDLPVVIVSGWSLAEIRGGVQPDHFLEKPVAADELIDVLQRHLRTNATA